MDKFKKLRIIADGPFAVISVQNPRTKEEQIVYVSGSIDLDKDSFDYEELKPIWW